MNLKINVPNNNLANHDIKNQYRKEEDDKKDDIVGILKIRLCFVKCPNFLCHFKSSMIYIEWNSI